MDRTRIARSLLTAVFYVLSSGLVFFLFVNVNGTFGTERGPGTLLPMVDGTASKPFVFRTLVPSAIEAVAGAVGPATDATLRAAFSGVLSRLFRIEYSLEALIALPIMFGCLLAVPFVLRLLARAMLPVSPLQEDVAPAVAMLFLPVLFLYNHYVYDPATLLLFSVASLLLARGRFLLFHAVFLLAAFNKETSVLLIPVFLLAGWGAMRRAALAAHLGALSLVWLGVKAYVSTRFAGNDGAFMEFHLFDHNLALLDHPMALAYFLGAVALFTLVAASGWRSAPVLARRGFLLILGTQAVMALFFGYVDELRQYYEAMPFLFVIGLSGVRALHQRGGSAPEGDSGRESPTGAAR